MTLDFGIYKDGRRLFAGVPVRNDEFSKTRKGPASASCLLPIPLEYAARWVGSGGLSEVRITAPWGEDIWRGRIEKIGAATGGTTITAFGQAVAMTDVPYTGLWSYTGTNDWREVTEDELAFADPSRFQMDRNNRLYMAVRKNHSSSANSRAVMVYQLPDRGARDVTNVSIDYDIVAADSLGYIISINAHTRTWGSLGTNFAVTTTSATGTLTLTPGANAQFITVQWRRNSATAHEYTGETGEEARAIITNIRIKTTTAASVLASDIAAALRAHTHTVNSGQIINSNALIESTSTDLLNATYEDVYPSKILDNLAGITHDWGVDERKQFYFKSRTVRRTWTIEAGRINLPHSLDNVANSAYVVFRDASGRKLRTEANSSQTGIDAFGVTRRVVLDNDTTSEAAAQAARDGFLVAKEGESIVADIETLRIMSSSGRRAKAWEIEPGDRVRVQNAPQYVQFGEAFGFVVNRMGYDRETGSLKLEPDMPTPTVANMLASATGRDAPTISGSGTTGIADGVLLDSGAIEGAQTGHQSFKQGVAINSPSPTAPLHIGVDAAAGGERNAIAMFSEGEHVMERDQLDSGANGTVLGLRRRNMAANSNRAVLRIAHQSVNNDPPDPSGRLGSNIAFQGTGYDGVDVEMGWLGFHWTFASTSGSKEQGFYMGVFEPVARAIINFTTGLFEIASDRLKWRVPNSAIADAALGNGEISWYLNEGSNQLIAKVKYSDGTVKTATITLS